MAYRDSYEDEEDEEGTLEDRDDPDESDMDEEDEDGPALVECPYCGSRISEDAEQCPRCGSYMSEEDAPRRKPPWILVTAVVLVAAILVTWVLWGG
jgi:predicted nucleic acid-binding Zn ribbon protein